jgi:hypothetical protein
MTSQLLVNEMVASITRERMDKIAWSSRNDWMAQAGHEVGRNSRARSLVSAVFQRAGRPQERGIAPAGGAQPLIDTRAINLRAAGD